MQRWSFQVLLCCFILSHPIAQQYHVIALRDLLQYIDPKPVPDDPQLKAAYFKK